MRKIHKIYARNISFLALTIAGSFSQRVAAQEPSRSNNAVEEIIVTAQKRAETAQSIPISMTVLSERALEQHSIINLGDIQAITPGLAVTKSTVNQFGAVFAIRGVTGGLAVESPVGVYVDEVYSAAQSIFGTNGVGLTGMLDVARIEVLKGPQGTLYGRNTAAGAVNIYSNLPTDQFEGEVTAKLGSDGFQQYTGIVNAPLVPGRLESRFAAEYARSNGFQKNNLGGDNLGAYSRYGFKGTLLMRPTESLTITVRANYGKAKGTGHPVQLIALRPDSTFLGEVATELGLPNTPVGRAAALTVASQYVTGPKASLAPVTRTRGSSSFETYGGSLTAEYQLSDSASIKSVSAYLHQGSAAVLDLDVTPFFGILTNPIATINQYTQELTLSGSAADDRLKYAIGGYYYHLKKDDNAVVQALVRINPASPQSILLHTDNDSLAAYAQATYSLLDNLRLTGGLRYTHETKDMTSRSHTATGCNVPLADRVNGQCLGLFHNSDSNISYTAGLDFQANRDILLYAKVATGFRAGGTNNGSAQAQSYNNFAPEKIATYEGGVKSQFMDRRLLLNLGYFYSDYTNLQKTSQVILPPNNLVLQTTNAAKARIQGVEFEASIRPVEGLSLGMTAAYTDSKYLKFADAAGDHSAQLLLDSPKWTYSLTGSYTVPVDNIGTIRTLIDWSWRDRVDLGPQEEVAPPLFTEQGSYGLLNARLELDVDRWGMTVAVFGRNILDKRHFTGNSANWGFGYVQGAVGDPQFFGVEVSKRF